MAKGKAKRVTTKQKAKAPSRSNLKKNVTKGVKARAAQASKNAAKNKAAKTEKATSRGQPRGSPARAEKPAVRGKPERTLRVDLRHDNDSTEVFWSLPGRAPRDREAKVGEEGWAWDGYYVSASLIDRLGETIRDHLHELQALDWVVTDEGVKGEVTRCKAILGQLIDTGRELHAAILRGLDGDDLSMKRAERFREWFNKNVLSAPAGTWRIEVIHAKYSRTIAPWALACVPMRREDMAQLDPRKPDQYSDFWGARFKLAVRGNTRDARDGSDTRDGGNMRLACVLELDEYAVTQMESRRPGEAERMRDHLGWDKDGYVELAQKHMRKDLFWYVSLQADKGSFVIGKDAISSSDLAENSTLNANTDRIVLMLLDGDAVIRGDRGPDWLRHALALGRSGLIAVETDIRNNRIKHFGWYILRDILTSEKPLLDAMSAARRKFWPLGLLYGIYCSPVHTAVMPPPAQTIRQVDDWISIIRSIPQEEAQSSS
ncbi:MAG: hypothetical protein K2P58_08675 [Hyphomonadaceae bacterium]|nr:hypothetical protein [Hyphomonadaceae bacterium]